MKAVIPAAGLGTRMLPATKSQPKEMLPVAKKPAIQYIVEELEQSGIRDILIITGKSKRAIDDHFDKDPILLSDLKEKNKYGQVRDLEALENLNVQIFYVRQTIPTGLADAVYLAKEFVGEDDFIVTLGDTIIDSNGHSKTHTQRLIDFHKQMNSFCTLSTEKIPMTDCERYGILDVQALNSADGTGRYHIKDLVEKPTIHDAPSNLAICGRYIFKPGIFDYIEKIDFGKGGEKQLTDAIRLAKNTGKLYALELAPHEQRFDIGTFPLYAIAFLEFCLKDEEIGPELRKHLSKKNL